MVPDLFESATRKGGSTILAEELIVHYYAHDRAQEPIVCPEGTEVYFPSMQFSINGFTGAASRSREKSRSRNLAVVFAPEAHMTITLRGDLYELSRLSRPRVSVYR
jgi:hypothetical protein